MMLNGAQILVEELILQGVATVFGYPGGAVLDIYDALHHSSDRIRHVLTAHEQGAAHAADGYARACGKTGVVIATSGPGATNLVTGIATAYLDSVPMVAVTGNVPLGLLGRDSFQEVDIVGITQPVVKHSYLVRDVADLAGVLRSAFALAGRGRRGPVLVDIPKTVQQQCCDYRPEAVPPPPAPAPGPGGPAAALEAARQAIARSRRPFICCGGGVLAARAEGEVLALSRRLGAPVGLSMMGLSALPASYPLNLGMCGMHGSRAANALQAQADLMIAVGSRFSDRATGNIREFTQGRPIIHIDVDEAELGKNIPSIIEVCGDARDVLTRLLDGLPESDSGDWRRQVARDLAASRQAGAEDAFSPQNIIGAVARALGPDALVATDVGQHQMWVAQHYPFEHPRSLLTSGGLGTMGFGMGAAIGGCMASGRRTVLFTGDGSFGMNLTELATAVSCRLPLLIILLNNGALGMVRQWQTLFYGERYAATTLARQTDFVKVAEAFGALGRRAAGLPALKAALADLPHDRPLLVDCTIDPDDKVFPMIPPGGSLRDIRLE